MKYRENIDTSKPYKQKYLDGLNNVISLREKELELKRQEYCKDIFTNQEIYREDFKNMLGWPLIGYQNKGVPTVKAEKLSEEDGYNIYRMSFEVLDGLEMTGLLFEMNTSDKKPLVIVQHGGLGTPELISGIYNSTGTYNDMLKRVVDHGAHAFAPQLLLWKHEEYGVPFSRADVDARLKRVGSSITAVELFAMSRILDYFELQKNVSNFGMLGLSYGGFYTLYLSAIDKRIKSAISCGYFNTRDDYNWSDWTWFNSASTFDDAEVACLVYPRKLCIEIGDKDPYFNVEYGKNAYKKLKDLTKPVGDSWLDFIVFDGEHEFYKDDKPITELIDTLTKNV